MAAIVIFFLFFAFRGYVFTDWVQYYQLFEEISWGDVVRMQTTIHEPGWLLLNMVCKTICNDYTFLVFVVTVIETWLLVRFMKQWEIRNWSMLLVVFIMFEGVLIMFNLLRNGITILIFMNALHYVREKQMIRYMALCIIAMTIHFSSAVFIPIYFILNLRLNRWTIAGVAIGCLALFIVQVSVIPRLMELIPGLSGIYGKVQTYTEYYTVTRKVAKSGLLLNYGLLALIVAKYDTIQERFPNAHIFINAYLLYLFFFYGLWEFGTLSERLCYLVVFSVWTLWYMVYKSLDITSNRCIMGSILTLLFVFLTIQNYNTPCQRYDNILTGAQSPGDRILILQKTYHDSLHTSE